VQEVLSSRTYRTGARIAQAGTPLLRALRKRRSP
jgi:hypothetical protein